MNHNFVAVRAYVTSTDSATIPHRLLGFVPLRFIIEPASVRVFVSSCSIEQSTRQSTRRLSVSSTIPLQRINCKVSLQIKVTAMYIYIYIYIYSRIHSKLHSRGRKFS